VPDRKKLFIIGASGFGRELEMWILRDCLDKEYEICGFLDDNPDALLGYPSNYNVIDSPLSYSFKNNDFALMGIADPLIKKYLVSRMNSRVKFLTYISKDAKIGIFNKIGTGSVICSGTVLTTNITIGEFVTINVGSQIGHDVSIGSFTSIMSNVEIGGKNIIGQDVFIGTGTTIIPSRTIGSQTKIGAGSVVIRNIGTNQSVFGNPAKRI